MITDTSTVRYYGVTKRVLFSSLPDFNGCSVGRKVVGENCILNEITVVHNLKRST